MLVTPRAAWLRAPPAHVGPLKIARQKHHRGRYMSSTLIACPECDLLQRSVPVVSDRVARCRRCLRVLYGPANDDLDRPLAFTLSAGILFIVANAFPIVGLELQGQSSAATLFGTAQALWQNQMKLLAGLVFFTTIVVPAIQLAAMAYVLVLLRFEHVPHFMPLALRAIQAVRPWGMVEVFILGLLVSLVKLAGMATVVPGTGLWSFGGLLLMIAAAVASFDPRAMWSKQKFTA